MGGVTDAIINHPPISHSVKNEDYTAGYLIHSFIHQGRRLAVGSLSTCLSAYRQR